MLAGAPLRAQHGDEPELANRPATSDTRPPQQPPGQALPIAPARHLRFTAERGTWLSLDEGRGRILFDLLGDLYSVPAGGGAAIRLTGGAGFDTQPTFSPDRRFVAFVSDRSGADNLWVMSADGSAPHQLSFNDDDTVMASPAWSADGRSLFVSRYRADLNNYELWQYSAGGGAGRLLVPIRDTVDAPRDLWRSTLGAVATPDGRSLVFARRVGGLDFDTVDEWTIVRRDLATGAETVLVAEPDGPRKALNPGAFFRPAVSRDGRLLAYGARREGRTEIRLRDLSTGADRSLVFPAEHDQLQASMWQDLLPRYAFSEDGRALVLSRAGRIEQVAIDGGAVTAVPFRATVDLAVGGSTRQAIREEDAGPIHARLAQFAVVAPDGRRVAWSSLGRVFIMPLDGGAPTRLAVPPAALPAYQPSWSPDGRTLAWVSWDEATGGAIWSAPADGSAPPRRLTDRPAFYTYPVFAPDGRTIVAVRSAQDARLRLYMEFGKLRDAELVTLPASGGPARVVMSGHIGSRPQFTHDGRLFVMSSAGLEQVDRGTGAHTRRVQVIGPGWYFQDGPQPVDDLRISPDGRQVAAQVAQQLFLLALPAADSTLDLTGDKGRFRRLTRGGADFFEWSRDGRTLFWSAGSRLVAQPVDSLALDTGAPPAEGRLWRLDALFDRPAPPPPLLLANARVLTMAGGDRVIERGDVLVVGGRFAAVGPAGTLAVPAGTRRLDFAGATIVPGLIDTHDHVATVRREVLGFDDWGLRARLAYGVTTSFDPSTLSIDMMAYQDALDGGLMLGPRLRSTGMAIFSFNRFQSLDEVRAVLRRYRDDYRLRNVKEYRTGNRRVRQWMAQAARELGLQPTTEGALSMKLDLTQIMDGYAGNEHALVAAPLQPDVLTLLREMRTSYTTTLEITNGGYEGQDWSISRDDPAGDPKLRRFWPGFALDQMFLHREWHPFTEYRFPAIAADAAALQRSGGLVGIGSHGEAPGIGFHYEMEAHAAGGMTPAEVLHAATIGSAETIGRATDLGSIEPGKLADLVVLDADPRLDLRNARRIRAVMRDGRLWDGATLTPLWPAGPVQAPWFEQRGERRQWLPEEKK
ncbi:amidohydrolase [Sphingomonas ginkgonis]|uniref:Amidohydrolase n=1 Tax=Sphingomonas ginkgonis TaxID=2315330 RepID=A0A3R9YL56_9SPHN|nr:amidohydrolase family protein [Sphingomonas ginkgonis]RST30262.1 amidohydrolase [Sphingomonas ginkgonis]